MTYGEDLAELPAQPALVLREESRAKLGPRSPTGLAGGRPDLLAWRERIIWDSCLPPFASWSPRISTSSANMRPSGWKTRGIMESLVVAGMADGEMIVERPVASPNPAVEVRETRPDGTEFKAVWSHLRQSDVAKLVTVRFFDEDW